MANTFNRREAMKTIAAASAAAMLPRAAMGDSPSLDIAGQRVELQLTSISPHTVRLALLPIQGSSVGPIPDDGALVKTEWGAPVATIRDAKPATVRCGEF